MSNQAGILYVVATPIGNLEDLSFRAISVLDTVDLIAAEDTRKSKILLERYGITTPMRSFHDFNEVKMVPVISELLLQGKNVALISDAGTPLVNDPGFKLVDKAHTHGIRVVPVPGANAIIAALCASGIALDRFVFDGFPPEKKTARRNYLKTLVSEPRTMVFYEVPHRILAFLADAVQILGDDRQATIARELTKKYETIRRDTLAQLLTWLNSNPEQQKGEFVVIIQGNQGKKGAEKAETDRVLKILLKTHSVKQAVAIATEICGNNRNELYKQAIELKEKQQQ